MANAAPLVTAFRTAFARVGDEAVKGGGSVRLAQIGGCAGESLALTGPRGLGADVQMQL